MLKPTYHACLAGLLLPPLTAIAAVSLLTVHKLPCKAGRGWSRQWSVLAGDAFAHGCGR